MADNGEQGMRREGEEGRDGGLNCFMLDLKHFSFQVFYMRSNKYINKWHTLFYLQTVTASLQIRAAFIFLSS